MYHLTSLHCYRYRFVLTLITVVGSHLATDDNRRSICDERFHYELQSLVYLHKNFHELSEEVVLFQMFSNKVLAFAGNYFLMYMQNNPILFPNVF